MKKQISMSFEVFSLSILFVSSSCQFCFQLVILFHGTRINNLAITVIVTCGHGRIQDLLWLNKKKQEVDSDVSYSR